MQKSKVFQSIKGIACLIVLYSHIIATNIEYGRYANGCGKIGVWCFMVLTGFLSVLPYLDGTKEIQEFSLLNYYKQKICKLYPAYIIVLIFAVLLNIFTWKDMLLHIVCVQGSYHFWYMTAMIKFYLLFPVFVLLLKLVDGSKWIFGIVVSVIAILTSVLFPFTQCLGNSMEIRWYIPVMCMGMLLSVLYSFFKTKIKVNYFWDILAVVSILFIICLTPLMRKLVFSIEPSAWLQNKYLLLGFVWCIFIFSIQFSRVLQKWLKNNKVLLFIGNSSYEIYLLHYVILVKMRDITKNTLWIMLVTIGVTIVMSVLVRKIVDKLKKSI